jgi:SAM-dependent methyltransferase
VTRQQLLARASVYRAFGRMVGASRARRSFVEDYVRPVAGQRVLDIGCGTGELVDYLAGLDYDGFDASPEYIRSARARYPGVRFTCEPISARVARPDRVDVAIACGVLHHLDDDEALELLHLASASCRAGGRLVTLDGCYVAGQSVIARTMLAWDRGRYVRTRDEYERLFRTVFPRVTAVVRHDLLRVPYTHLIAECHRA